MRGQRSQTGMNRQHIYCFHPLSNQNHRAKKRRGEVTSVHIFVFISHSLKGNKSYEAERNKDYKHYDRHGLHEAGERELRALSAVEFKSSEAGR